MAAFATEEVPIPKKVHTLLTGPKKRLVQAIKTECGSVTIKFPPAESKSDIVTIRGLDKEDVKRARDMLMELAAETEQASFTAELRVKPEHHNFIIGRKGMNVKRVIVGFYLCSRFIHSFIHSLSCFRKQGFE